jgi:hypothetical protein
MPSRPLLVAALAAAGCLLAPAAATADSIVYADRGDIWTMRPDGSGKVKLTDGGRWHSPTQADDGTIAAVEGTGPITVMARDGRVLRTISTPPARSGDGGSFAPAPVDLSFSPDGSKLAYAYVATSCPVASSCGTIQRSTFYTRADVAQATPHDVWGNQFGVSDPEWITNDRALVFGGYGSQVSIDDLGGGDYSFVNWLKPDTDQGDGELSRDGRRLATTFSYGENLILAFFAVSGDATQGPPPAATPACNSSSPDAALADPSWAPDSAGLAFQSRDGIETLRFTKLDATGCAITGPSVVVAPTGSQPDWGPADPPAARFAAPGAPGPAPAPAPRPATGAGGGPAAGGGASGAGRLAVVAGGAARQAFRGTLTVRCTAPVRAACTASAAVKVGRKVHRAKVTRTVPAGRATTLRLRFSGASTKAIRAALRRSALRASVTLTASAPGGATGTARRTVRLSR